VHFLRESAPARLLGRKALTVNLSDVAAMGGLARYATVSLCLPSELELGWVDSLYDGLLERGAEAGVAIVGGNVTRSPGAIAIDVTLLGDAGRLVLRNGARAGDSVVVTGALGAAAEGVRLLADGARLDEEGELCALGPWTDSSAAAVIACLRAQLDPRPPLALARSIGDRGLAHAGMDLSDGLSSDLLQICQESNLGAVVELGMLPVDARAAALERARGGDALSLGLHGGEDYQLLLAVPTAEVEELSELARVWGIGVTAIGEFVEGEPEVRVRDTAGERPLEPGGHDHFGRVA
jgi:thiamine-monophosphate kinase